MKYDDVNHRITLRRRRNREGDVERMVEERSFRLRKVITHDVLVRQKMTNSFWQLPTSLHSAVAEGILFQI